MTDADLPGSGDTPPEPTRSGAKATKKRRRTVLISAIAAVAVVALGAGAAFAFLGNPVPAQSPSASGSASSTPTPSPSPTPTDAELARTALFHGTVDGWDLPASDELAAVLPAAGSAHTGQVSIGIDAPALRTPTDAAVTTVTVQPGVTYDAQAWVRVQVEERAAVPAEIRFGDAVIALPETNADWQLVETQVTVPEGVTSLPVSVRVNEALTGLYVDDVSLTGPDGVNVVPNPSFDAVQTTQQGILNDSLVMTTQTATIATALPTGEGTWEVRGTDDAVIASGALTSGGPITSIPLEGVPQGYQTLTVNGPGGVTATTPIAIVDSETATIPIDHRFGVTVQYDRAWHAGGGRLAAALGYGDVHADAFWSRNQYVAGQYKFDETYISEFAKVRAQGLGLTGVIVYGNKLYDGGKFPSTAEGIEAFGAYAAAAAQEFPFTAIEVFNEPNEDRFNKSTCGTDPSCYIPLLESVQRHVGAVNPDLPIIGGATALYDKEWFEGLYQDGGMAQTDIVSFHPYEGWINRDPDLMKPTMAQALADMDQFANARRPIWITEMGFTTMTGGVSREQQRDWLIRSEALGLAGGAEKYFWYDIVDDSTDPASGEGNFGLYEQAKHTNVIANTPKPAAYAQALMISQLNGRAFTADESDDTTTMIAFGQGEDTVRILWAASGQGQRTYESSKPVSVVTTDGKTTIIQPVAGKVTVPLTDSPSFVSIVTTSNSGDTVGKGSPSPTPSGTSTPAKPKEDDD